MASQIKPLIPSSSSSPSPSPSSSSSSVDWPDEAVSVLLQTYSEKFSVDRGYLRNTDWEYVANSVNTSCHSVITLKTVKQCKDKLDSLKRRFKSEKRKLAVNGGVAVVSWPFFHSVEAILNSVMMMKNGRKDSPQHQMPMVRNLAKNVVSKEDDNSGNHDNGNECGNDGIDNDPHDDADDMHDDDTHDDDTHDDDTHDDAHDDGVKQPSHPQPPHLNAGVSRVHVGCHDSSHHSKRAVKRKLECENGMHTLVDAVNGLSRSGFLDVFARIDKAKMNIFAKMNVELLELERN